MTGIITEPMNQGAIMRDSPFRLQTGVLVIFLFLAMGGGSASAQMRPGFPVAEETQRPAADFRNGAPARDRQAQNFTWRMRVISDREINSISRRDPELSPSAIRKILARLNVRAPYYIEEDIQKGRPLKVPNNFSAFKHWTPLPKRIPEIAHIPKFILVMKDIPYVGWYEKGQLVGDTHACIGRMQGWTKSGVYRVLDKDVDKFSRSYKNAYGDPAPMPWALRIYGLVWIHAGDITGGNCSRGCINLPMFPAMALFDWAQKGTPVLVAESMYDLERVIAHNRARRSTASGDSLIYPAQTEKRNESALATAPVTPRQRHTASPGN
jgi:hypothetical protein